MDMMAAVVLIVALFAVLGAGMWIGLGLLAVGLIGMELFTSRPVGDSMMLTIWGASSAWTLTALPLFLWMGEILFRSKLSDSMFRGLAPWMDKLPGGCCTPTWWVAPFLRRSPARRRPPAPRSAR